MGTSRGTQMNHRLRHARIERNWRQRDLAEQLGTTVVTVKRWERGYQQPGPYFHARLCALFGKSAEELGLSKGDPSSPATEENVLATQHASFFPTEPEAIWTVPYLRNPHFTGRDDLLEHLARHLSFQKERDATTTRRAVLSQPQALKGLGGVGKTQIAVEYAYRSRERGYYTHIFWINTANEEAIINSFLNCAALLPNFPEKDEKNQHRLINAIKGWLEQCQQPWLLILDNADDLALVQPYIPLQGQGSILLTTRATAVGWLATSIEVDQMGVVEGTRFLLHRAQRLAVTDEEFNVASNVVVALDGLPLALDQAGAYIEETRCSFEDYLQFYERHRARLLARRGKQITNYPDSVATTWLLSFQRIEQAHPAAAELLQLCAYLSPDHIPEELLTQGAACWPTMLQEAVTEQLRLNELLEALLAFSLVKRMAHERLLSLHRLVQAVQLDLMDLEMRRQWAERVVRAVNTLFPADPKNEIETWPLCLRYLEQVQACDTLIQQYHLQLPEAADLLERAGIYLREHASYSLAESLFQRALAIAEQQLGPQHLQVASLLNNLGELCRGQGRYELAEPLYQRALHIREQVLAPDHPLLASLLNNLGALYREQGKYEQAEPPFQQALHIFEQILGLDHPLLATPLQNLGSLYREQGRYKQAEPLHQRALHIWEHALGADHPRVAYPLNSLGILYKEQGKYELAEPPFQRALHIWEHALGPHHPDVAHPLNNLAELYMEQGAYEMAEPLLQRALHIWEHALGPHHPHLASPLMNLGHIAFERGAYEMAEPLLQRALHIWEHALGPHHPQVAESLNELANLYREQGQHEQAEALYQRAIVLQQEQLGPEHLAVAETLQNMAQLRERQQHPAEALSLYQQALGIRTQVLGAHHAKTIETRQHLYAALQALGRTEEAALLEAHPPATGQRGEQITHEEETISEEG